MEREIMHNHQRIQEVAVWHSTGMDSTHLLVLDTLVNVIWIVWKKISRFEVSKFFFLFCFIVLHLKRTFEIGCVVAFTLKKKPLSQWCHIQAGTWILFSNWLFLKSPLQNVKGTNLTNDDLRYPWCPFSIT